MEEYVFNHINAGNKNRQGFLSGYGARVSARSLTLDSVAADY